MKNWKRIIAKEYLIILGFVAGNFIFLTVRTFLLEAKARGKDYYIFACIAYAVFWLIRSVLWAIRQLREKD